MSNKKSEEILNKAFENIAETLSEKAAAQKALEAKNKAREEKMWEGIIGSLEKSVKNKDKNKSIEERKTEMKSQITDFIGNLIMEKITDKTIESTPKNLETSAASESSTEDKLLAFVDDVINKKANEEQDIVEVSQPSIPVEVDMKSGLTINWLGEFKQPPARSKDLDMYRDTTQCAVYIKFKKKWNLFVKDGLNPQVPPGGGLGKRDVISLIETYDQNTWPSVSADYYNKVEVNALIAEVSAADDDTWPSVSADYYTKVETYSQSEVNNLIENASQHGTYSKVTSATDNYVVSASDYLIYAYPTEHTTYTIPTSANLNNKSIKIFNYGSYVIDLIAESGLMPNTRHYIFPGELTETVFSETENAWVVQGISFSKNLRDGLVHIQGTGVYTFEGLSITSGDNTKFDVGACTGTFNDPTDLTHPPIYLNYAGETGITPIGIGLGSSKTYIGVSAVDGDENITGGVIVQQTTKFTTEQLRTIIRLGRVIHLDSFIQVVNDNPLLAASISTNLDDLANSIGLFNKTGNIYGPLTNLEFAKTVGEIYGIGENLVENVNNPSIVNIPAESPISFKYRFSDDSESGLFTNIDPDHYESSPGTSAVVPSNDYTIQRIYLFPSGRTRVQYGQATYAKKSDAILGIRTEVFTVAPSFEGDAILRSLLIIKTGTTDLTDSANAEFISVGRFGDAESVGQTSVTDLQGAYNNSNQPEIETNATLGAVSLKQGALAPAEVLEIINTLGQSTGYIRGDGSVSGSDIQVNSGKVNGYDIATREANPSTSAIAFWNNTLGIFETQSDFYWNGSQVIVGTKPLAPINDSGATTQETYSSTKIESRLSDKSDITHSHFLDDLYDVVISNPIDGQSLIYSSAVGDWVNGAGGSGAGGATVAAGGAGTLQTCHIANANGLVSFGNLSTQYPRYTVLMSTNDVKSVDRLKVYIYSITGTIDLEIGLYSKEGGTLTRLIGGSTTVTSAGFLDIPLSSGINLTAGVEYYIGIIKQTTSADCEFAVEESLSTTDISFVGAGVITPFSIPATDSSLTGVNYTIWGMLYSSNGGDFNSFTTTTKTTDYTAVRNNVILCDTSLNPLTITLPDATLNKDKEIKIKKISTDSRVVTISGAQTIDGQSSIELTYYRSAINIISDGSQWWIV